MDAKTLISFCFILFLNDSKTSKAQGGNLILFSNKTNSLCFQFIYLLLIICFHINNILHLLGLASAFFNSNYGISHWLNNLPRIQMFLFKTSTAGNRENAHAVVSL